MSDQPPESVPPAVDDYGDREKYRQKRRKPRSPRDLDESSISKVIEEAYDLVPEIGEGYRWYDWPYRSLRWLGSGWRRKLFPGRAGNWIWSGVNYLIPFAEHDRDKVWPLDDLHHNLFVPKDEHVKVAGIWAIELFPPAELHAFEHALRKNGWQRRQRWASHEEDNSTVLERSRSGGGAWWWRLIDVVKRDSKWFVPDGVEADLPPQFEVIHLRAIQVGAGLTAVLAEFTLTEVAATSLDEEWHRRHEPMMLPTKGGGRPRNFDRQWSAYWQTQTKRRDLHDAARDWMSKMVPGYFAIHKSAQPLFDLLLFEQLDPTEEPYVELAHEERIKRSNALRALGLDDHRFHHVTSEHLPNLVLSPLNDHLHEALGDAPTWTLWGNRDAIIEAIGKDTLSMVGGSAERAISYRVKYMYNMQVMLAVSEFLHVSNKRYAAIRDHASTRHGKFKPAALRELRRNLLTLSLNIATVRRDVTEFWKSPVWRWDGGAEFDYVPTPWTKFRDEKAGRKPDKPTSFNKEVRKQHNKQFRQLAQADRDYRDILSTVASLGASVDAFKIGRWALFVAIVSLIVAMGTIALADAGCSSLVHQLLGWPSGVQCQTLP
ncbi:hypothetical protein SAMN05443377_10216 [Propionibacterium cyclohexanicum]|uniref:Uncharacterized protein n=1 Tax=Propionibacterium cyclohexanicum TaxID=64702 RepID=A0A1H9PY84_9ACTN|nr:hypothetical protein [Propionibacterium cyclohexanicum]SER53167.1 hypothetical protein SAMN05443377_10216 [Propionibacterium cyclohexanicum]